MQKLRFNYWREHTTDVNVDTAHQRGGQHIRYSVGFQQYEFSVRQNKLIDCAVNRICNPVLAYTKSFILTFLTNLVILTRAW
ncbi:hypothetical protein D3C86_2052400 [compost metagenome]